MRVHPFKIPRTSNSSIGLQQDFVPHFYDIFHQHPEIQLTVMLESTGTLFLGDYIGNFEPGNVFLIGANVPHVFKNDKAYYERDANKTARSVSVFFEGHSLGKDFLQLPEAWRVKELFSKTRRGLKFGSTTYQKILPLITNIFVVKDLHKIVCFLEILDILANEEHCYLTQDAANYNVDENDGKRLNDIFQFTMNEFGREITLEEVAEIAHMTPSSFCRYFKQRTRKTYFDFLTEIRINHACKLLLMQDFSIAEISELCGFNNLSNFNRQFKRIKGYTPTTLKRTPAAIGI